MALSGGAADKLGNRYEDWWTLWHVADVLEAGETVDYTVTPVYRGSELLPFVVRMRARGSGGLSIDTVIPNRKS